MFVDLDGHGVEKLLELLGERDAVDWLRDRLQGGPEAITTIKQAWMAQGGLLRYLSVAQQSLGIEVQNIEGCVAWKLPDKS